MQFADCHSGGWCVGWECSLHTITAGRMWSCGSNVKLLLLDVGVRWFTFMMHQYNTSMAIALPDGRAHQVTIEGVGVGAA